MCMLFFFVCEKNTNSDMLVIKKGYESVPCVAAITKSLEPMTGQMSNLIAAKLTAVEATLKENVTKVVKSKVCSRTIAEIITIKPKEL